MHARAVVTICLLSLSPAAALAQTANSSAAPPPAAPTAAAAQPQGITRDEYIARAVDRAKRSAATRFDRIDTNHTGVLTRAEIHAYYEAHRRHRAAHGAAPAGGSSR